MVYNLGERVTPVTPFTLPKKKIKSKNCKKNILDDLPGVKIRKFEEKMAKHPTGGLTRGEKKQIKSKIGKKTYWRTFKG